jgi:hypothetical protein
MAIKIEKDTQSVLLGGRNFGQKFPKTGEKRFG